MKKKRTTIVGGIGFLTFANHGALYQIRGGNMSAFPKDYYPQPFGSIFHKSEYETVARNILIILGRTGNTWREISWEEYKEHRLRDGNFTDNEYGYFIEVMPYCQNPEKAAQFSRVWREITENHK